MEYRKLISFGKSSFVISLPKSWVSAHKLHKGDLIYLDETDPDLILSANKDKNSGDREITITVEGKSLRRIQREIISAYIKNFKTINLTGKDLKDRAKGIQDTIHNLMALEVLEQTSTRIVAKDFLDMTNISIFNLIRKIDVILRAMIDDCEKMFLEDNYENINHRDNDVNRLSFLLFRTVEFGLENSSFMFKKHKLRSRDLLGIWWFVFNLEAIGDDIKRISRYMRNIDLDQKQKDRLLALIAEIKICYLKMLKGFHNREVNLAHEILENKERMLRDGEEFYNQNKKVENIGLLIGTLRSIVNNIHNLGRVIYQHEFTIE